MSDFADVIKQKRAESIKEQQARQLHTDGIDAINGKIQSMIDAFAQQNTKPHDVTVLNEGLASKEDIDKVLEQLKENSIAQYLSAQNSPKLTQIISDPLARYSDQLTELGDKLMEKLDSDTSGDDNHVLLQQLHEALQEFNSAHQGDTSAMEASLKKVSDAVDKIDVQPIVNVQPPKVTVKAPVINLQPLQDTLEKYLNSDDDQDDTVDLNCYRAQDLKNDGDIQYIGFVHPNGTWYIIENQTKKNSLRYVFGKEDYQKAFADAASYEYTTLDEAVNALSA